MKTVKAILLWLIVPTAILLISWLVRKSINERSANPEMSLFTRGSYVYGIQRKLNFFNKIKGKQLIKENGTLNIETVKALKEIGIRLPMRMSELSIALQNYEKDLAESKTGVRPNIVYSIQGNNKPTFKDWKILSGSAWADELILSNE